MKKPLAVLLGLLLLAGLVGCGAQPPAEASSVLPPAASSSVSAFQPSIEEPEPQKLYPWVLTGKELPQDYGQNRRITAVVVDNFKNARPQRGLSEADILFECLVEGGITRFLALYADYRGMPQVGPVRSSRDQFFQLAYPFEAIMVTDGNSQMLDNYLQVYDYKDHALDTRHGYEGITLLDEERLGGGFAQEHARYTSGQQITDALGSGGISGERVYDSTFFNFVPYNEPPRALEEVGAGSVVIRHSANYITGMAYENGRYTMAQNSADDAMTPTVDENTGEALAFDNVLVLFAEMPAYEGLTADVRNVQFSFGGVGYYFCGGKTERIRWLKDSPMHGLRLLSYDGTETDIALNPGTSYVALVDVEMAAEFAYGAQGQERSLG